MAVEKVPIEWLTGVNGQHLAALPLNIIGGKRRRAKPMSEEIHPLATDELVSLQK